MEKLQGKKEGSSMMVSSPVSSPPSASTSPSHEFSFTISLHNSSSSNIVPDNNKSKTPPSSSIAIDLTPADDIFFHGHLLPLHLLSHLSVSPRSSTNSLDSFTLPIRELLENDPPLPKPEKTSKSDNHIRTNIEAIQATSSSSRQQKKFKSFSLFSFTRRQKARVLEVEGNKDQKKHDKRRVRFDISHVLKRYVNMVRPLLFFKGKREKLHNIHMQAYSFSGNLRNKNEEFMKGIRKGEYSSAPASMRTSPTNSGLLVATTPFPSSTSDSTMEELQAAIQAAIAHCKNSIRGEEKLKC